MHLLFSVCNFSPRQKAMGMMTDLKFSCKIAFINIILHEKMHFYLRLLNCSILNCHHTYYVYIIIKNVKKQCRLKLLLNS